MATQSVGPLTLRSEYLSATNEVLLLQSYATVLLEQVPLDLPVAADLAYEITTYQGQMRDKALDAQNRVVPAYIGLVSRASNFTALWKAALDLTLPQLKVASSNEAARKSSQLTFAELSNQAGTTNQVASAFTDDLKILNGSLATLDSKFHAVLKTAIKELGAEAVAESAKIDELKAAIDQNINDIVAGATKTGAAVTGLVTGILTQISGAKPDSGSEGGKGDGGKGDAGKGEGGDGGDGTGGEGDGDDGDEDAGGAEEAVALQKGDDAGKGEEGSKPASADFVVVAIQGASEGTAETAKARADLNANNEKLAAAYQALARASALVAVAKVVAVQNEMFTSAMKTVQQNYATIAATWGEAPITPPGSGISLGFADFAQQIEKISSQQDADRLVALAQHAATDWSLLNDQLVNLKTAMMGAPSAALK